MLEPRQASSELLLAEEAQGRDVFIPHLLDVAVSREPLLEYHRLGPDSSKPGGPHHSHDGRDRREPFQIEPRQAWKELIQRGFLDLAVRDGPDQAPPAGLEDPGHLGERAGLVPKMMKDQAHEGKVEEPFREGEGLGIPQDPADGRCPLLPLGLGQHLLREVEAPDFGPSQPLEGDRQPPRPAADVQDPHPVGEPPPPDEHL
jgi:hypothetical protein